MISPKRAQPFECRCAFSSAWADRKRFGRCVCSCASKEYPSAASAARRGHCTHYPGYFFREDPISFKGAEGKSREFNQFIHAAMGPAIVVENGSIHADGMKAVTEILSFSWWLRGRSERKLCNMQLHEGAFGAHMHG